MRLWLRLRNRDWALSLSSGLLARRVTVALMGTLTSVCDSERLAAAYAFDWPSVHEQILRAARLSRQAVSDNIMPVETDHAPYLP